MKKAIFSTILLCSLASQGVEELRPFAKGLDATLQFLNSTSAGLCNQNSLTTVNATRRVHLSPQQASSHNAASELHKATVLSEKDAQKLFNELKSDASIPFEFSIAGCEERAHEMSRLMLLKGITPLKVFASVDENESPRLRRPNPTKLGTTVDWKYHVAPVVLVQKGKLVVPYVLDPSLETKAVPVSEWQKAMTRHDPNMKVKINFTPATQFDEQGRVIVNFKDNDFNSSIKQTLLDHKIRSKDEDGEDQLWFQLRRDEERMMMFEAPDY